VYVNGNPARTDPAVRKLEQESAQLSWLNPYTGLVQNNITAALADPVAERTLHMVTADPLRTPTFTLFADPDWFFFASGSPATCATPDACASIPARTSQSFAWNHGDIQDEIASTWIGYVGPGVDHMGVYGKVWSDHTDARPTILALTGLKDDYSHDGRVITEILNNNAQPAAVRKSESFTALARAYKQINATFGEFSMDLLKASTRALASNDANDATYTKIEGQIESLTDQRNALSAKMIALLEGAEYNNKSFGLKQSLPLIEQALGLLIQARRLAAGH
jgi:hypothetical protein